MLDRARKLRVQCAIVAKQHLFTARLDFAITGPARMVREFQQALINGRAG